MSLFRKAESLKIDIRFLHLATADHGGAGTAALRLHEAQLAAGIQSRMVVWEKRNDVPFVSCLKSNRWGREIRRTAARAWSKLATDRKFFFQDQILSLFDVNEIELLIRDFQPDVVVAYYISGFANFADLQSIHELSGARIVFYLLDMASMTGGCHYSWECRAYQGGCGNCLALAARRPRDLSRRTIELKENALRGCDHVVLAGSSTLFEQARSSTIFRHSDIRTVLLGVDPAKFPIEQRANLRRRHGFNDDEQVVMFGAQGLSERRKGMKEMLESLRILPDLLPAGSRCPSLLVVGDDEGMCEGSLSRYRTLAPGRVPSEQLAEFYVMADVFVCPSLEDSGPMMINESLMAGTPVVCFNMGVASDLIKPGITGLIADRKEPAALAKSMAEALSWDDMRASRIRSSCRTVALELCSFASQIEALHAVGSERHSFRLDPDQP